MSQVKLAPAISVTNRNVSGATGLPGTVTGAAFVDTLTGDTTYSAPSGALAGIECAVDLRLVQDGSGGHSVTWFAGITWLQGSAPSIPSGAGSSIVVTLITLDGGTTWFGSYNSAASIEPWRVIGASGQPAFGSAWSSQGAPNAPVQFAKTASGMVHIEGIAASSGVASGFVTSTIFTLPVGYRPAARLQRQALPWNGTTFGSGQFFINADGTVAWNWGSVAPSQVSLYAHFRAEQ